MKKGNEPNRIKAIYLLKQARAVNFFSKILLGNKDVKFKKL